MIMAMTAIKTLLEKLSMNNSNGKSMYEKDCEMKCQKFKSINKNTNKMEWKNIVILICDNCKGETLECDRCDGTGYYCSCDCGEYHEKCDCVDGKIICNCK